ncbi:hypothetical protein ARMSODRAFT_1026187 [Armillaria solidipes]|uniref:Uncharacterized protein n=1 Tax=Armillaria solidipes TaxID=1076256 RepID=A0A2H3AQ58_9AGAR|nr:hypothetical protein ARMSODRAFT_1026187 [Armillaria solidipes]
MPLSSLGYCGNVFPFLHVASTVSSCRTIALPIVYFPGLISRTVRVESHAEGYSVNRILAAVKANPTELIAGAKDRLLVRVFNEDTSKDSVVSESGTSGAVPKVDDTLSPPLSAVNVVLGRLGTARRMLQSWILDSPKRTATACYLGIHQAFQALVDHGISASFLTNRDGYILPGWFSAAQGMVTCHIQSPAVRCQGICGTPSIGNSEGSRHGNSTGIRLVTALQLESVFFNESPGMTTGG